MNKITRDDTEHGVEYVRADEAQAEVLEQCRINGMSAEREDALRAEIKRLKAAQPVPVKTYHDGKPWPVAPKPWVGLTKDDVESWDLPVNPTVFEFAQFIESKLKEKNT
jgi:hypothetical protein